MPTSAINAPPPANIIGTADDGPQFLKRQEVRDGADAHTDARENGVEHTCAR